MKKDLSPYYKDKKVFITGHTGFKGSWLTAWLELLGATVKGYALPPEYEYSLFSLLQPLEKGNNILADIRDKERLKKEIKSFQPDYIFHLAAQPLVRTSYNIPAETFDINVTGTANLLEAAIGLPGKCIITVITTDKVYENKEQDILYKESDQLGGYDPYSASKACAEIVVSSFRNSFFNPANYDHHQKSIVSVRAGNVIGGGDWNKDRIIPDIIRALQDNKPVEVRNPGAVRPWQHVLEPISGYLSLAAHLSDRTANISPAYNFGPLPNDHLSVRELVEQAIKSWGQGSWKDISQANQPHEANLLKLDIGLANRELEWFPKLTAVQAVAWTMNWYKQPVKQQADYTFEQIKEFISL